jgi:uncharacterized protein YrrD
MKVMFCCVALLLGLFACREQSTHHQKSTMQIDTMQFVMPDSIIAVSPNETDTILKDSLVTVPK